MKLSYRILMIVLLLGLVVGSAYATVRTATITLGRNPEPPYCTRNPGGNVQIFWTIQHSTTPNYVKYQLFAPDHVTVIQTQTYPGSTGLIVNRSWTVPVGAVDGKYWVRIEYYSFEAGDEADAEVTFYVCTSVADIIAHKYEDANCNGQLDPSDPPVPGWWLCIQTPYGETICRQTDANGLASWAGVPPGQYTVFEYPVYGWEPIGPTSQTGNAGPGAPLDVTFLNARYESCYGACCFPTGACSQLKPEECAAQGGNFLGLGSLCDPNPCPQPEACCFHDGHCVVLIPELCTAQGGVPHGVGTICDPNPCPQPNGACCFHDGTCLVLTQVECVARGGAWQGMDTACQPNPCPQPFGACCFHDGHCESLTEERCVTAGGRGGTASTRSVSRSTARSPSAHAASTTATASI